jgi:hypothetical protein
VGPHVSSAQDVPGCYLVFVAHDVTE